MSTSSATFATPAPRAEQVLPGVYRVDCPFGSGGLVHVYYLDTPEPALIDTAVKRSVSEVIEPALAAAGFSLGAVRHVFNTHGHWDHMGGNAALRRAAPHARIAMHPADQHLLADLRSHTHGYSTYPSWIMGDRQALEMQQAMLRDNIEVPTPLDVPVKDGQVFSLGGNERLRAVHTPGHSHGSTSYLLEGSGAFFTGDAIQGLGSRAGQLPLVFEDTRAYRATLAKVADVPFDTLCLGHAFCGMDAQAPQEPVRRGAAARQFLEESGEAAKAVEEAMRSVIEAEGAADFLTVARRTLARVAGPLGVQLDDAGLSVRSLATLHAFYREMTGAPPPV